MCHRLSIRRLVIRVAASGMAIEDRPFPICEVKEDVSMTLLPDCPVPDFPRDCITLAHGEGGKLMRRLLRERILPLLAYDRNDDAADDQADEQADAARLPRLDGPVAVTTDSYVVSPIFFPGGDIGSLAVYGTTNDLAVAGAEPVAITLALILEEGLPLEILDRVLNRVAETAREVGVRVITGDTKVVPRGAADRLFLNTTGIGTIVAPEVPGPAKLQVGDELLVTGPIARHGIAVLAARERIEFENLPTSDCGSLLPAVRAMRRAELSLRAMRDATRGGVAAVLHEWAEASGLTMTVDEAALPVTAEVRGVCELLGLDPIHVANEGTMIAALPAGTGQQAADVLRQIPPFNNATVIGQVSRPQLAPVIVYRLGQPMPLDEPLGALLPRIC